jgi:hypothetical protein
VQKNVCNTNVVFGIGVFEDETCFEQISVLFLYLFEIHRDFLIFFLQFTHLKLIYLGIVFKCRFNGNYHVFTHLNFDVPLEGEDLLFGGHNMKYNFNTCLFN